MLTENTTDYYNILQVHHDAEKDVIDAAYRCLSKLYHPDLNRTPVAAERMKDINAAYQVIGNEASRDEYHRHWMRKNAWKTLSDWGSAYGRASEDREAYSAFEMIDSFFRETLNEKWESAYSRLTAVDRSNVSFQDFLEWKQAVHSVYRLGNYHINYFRMYSNCQYSGSIYPKIFHFIVRVTELQLATGQIAESSSHKYVALDEGVLRVCLGKHDLKPATAKFRELADTISRQELNDSFVKAVNKIDVGTGALARSGWLEEAEKEHERQRRYGRKFCIGAIGFEPGLAPDGSLHGEETLEANIAYVSEFIAGHIRKNDVIGRCSDLALAVLFPETRAKAGRYALEKLIRLMGEDAHLGSSFPCRITAAVKHVSGPIEEELDSLLEKIGIQTDKAE
jgi:GGDEF domain-containing protein